MLKQVWFWNYSGEGGLLDKFYTVEDKHFDLIKKKCSLDIDFSKNSPRPDIPKKYGTHLDYPGSYLEIAKSDSKRPLYEVQQLERKLVITKQTIYDKRGCYRWYHGGYGSKTKMILIISIFKYVCFIKTRF